MQILSKNGVFEIVLEQFGGGNVLQTIENDFDV
jgi:hypothetical protein